MVSEQNKSAQLLLYFCGLLIAISFYSFGNFGFLNIFDARREIQLVLLLMLMPILSLIAAKKIGRFLKEPLWLLVLCFLIAEIIITQHVINIFTYLISLITIGALLTMESKYVNYITKCIIVLCGIFSIMGIIQFVVLWFNPGLSAFMAHRYSSAMSADTISNISAIEYLGFIVADGGTSLLGHHVYRFKSFAAEPSVLVYSFLCPGILALSYRGMIRVLAYPILVFTIVFVASGTIWLCILFSLILFPIGYFFKKSPRSGSLTIMLIIMMVMVLITKIDIPLFMRSTIDFLSPISSFHSMPLQKYGSGVDRLTSMTYGFEKMWTHPFGYGSVGTLGVMAGLIVVFGLTCGFPGLLLISVIFYRMFKYGIHVWQGYGKKGKIFTALLCGTLLQASFFSAYGWTSFAGLIMLCLLYIRIRELSAGLTVVSAMHQELNGKTGPFLSCQHQNGKRSKTIKRLGKHLRISGSR